MKSYLLIDVVLCQVWIWMYGRGVGSQHWGHGASSIAPQQNMATHSAG